MVIALLIVIIGALLWPNETRALIALPFVATWLLVTLPFKAVWWLLKYIWTRLLARQPTASTAAVEKASLIDRFDDDYLAIGGYTQRAAEQQWTQQVSDKEAIFGFLKFTAWLGVAIVLVAALQGHI